MPMPKMSLGAYTFLKNPSGMTFLQKPRINSSAETYTSVAVFDWGTNWAGKKIKLTWGYISTVQYASMASIYEAGSIVVFDPQDGEAHTFNVKVQNLNCSYHLQLTNATRKFRKDVELDLLIIDEV
jgi:hypothetical protein